jgi:hypothetical protein
MVTGLNLSLDVWRTEYYTDDMIGGAVVSGTLQFHNVIARFEADLPTQVILEQGLETDHIITAVVVPGTLDIRERDEVEIIAPYDHWDINKRFRVVGVAHSSHNPRDPRNYMLLSLTRSVRAHTRQ